MLTVVLVVRLCGTVGVPVTRSGVSVILGNHLWLSASRSCGDLVAADKLFKCGVGHQSFLIDEDVSLYVVVSNSARRVKDWLKT